MARPVRDGVGYFPKDTDFYQDDKVRLLRAEFGAKGMYLLDYLLCELYGKNGYFIPWDNNKCKLIADGAGCGCSPDFVNELIRGGFQCSFFDKRVFDAYGVLTSRGIQRRYIRMFGSREEISIVEEYCLLDINDKKDVPTSILNKLAFKSDKTTENPFKTIGNPFKTTVNPQNKVNKNKVKENKINNIPAGLEDDWNAFAEMRKNLKKPLTEYAEKLAFQKLSSLAPNDIDKQRKIIQQSILNGWSGFYEVKEKWEAKNVNDNGGAFNTNQNSNSTGHRGNVL